MRIAEIFYSLQGEGSLAGVPSVFLRLSGCPLRCRWCDTKYAWSEHSGELLSTKAIVAQFKSYNCPYLVITGGEPFTNDQLPKLIAALRPFAKHITVETAGIEYIGDLPLNLVSLSPKLSNSLPIDEQQASEHDDKRLNIDALSKFVATYNVQFKFVVQSQEDIAEIETILEHCPAIDKRQVMLMPQATIARAYLQEAKKIADICIETGYSFSPRLQVMLWSNKRGV